MEEMIYIKFEKNYLKNVPLEYFGYQGLNIPKLMCECKKCGKNRLKRCRIKK